ncbi:NB-ARC domain-containing protein [Desulfobulbus oligotrophicus]|uniref:ATP-binding protein n=1 Tax=Desulfobulbus oligotrophicus TaxID=1909699 RepID=A0A7T5VBG7_9BACT|nr:NB-ARC domain-containing protein [Desulfobulbus oligotrophicus]QQG64756.1 ATP-binding protein [Desulfobulbus oligotrophicus]
MKRGPLFEKIQERVDFEKDEGDIAYFYALMSQIEYVTKLVVLGVLACLTEDTDRNKYSLEYKLIRANSIGEWVEVLTTALTGPPAQFIRQDARHITRDLTERVAKSDWRYEVVSLATDVATAFGLDGSIGHRVALRQFFEFGVMIRNRTKGHGTPTSDQCYDVCPKLQQAVDLVLEKYVLFNHDWAHLYRNLSRKYRVSKLLGDCAEFDYLKTTRDHNLQDGVYFNLDTLIEVKLISTKPGIPNIYLPNGNYRDRAYELLSYFSNDIDQGDATSWSKPPGRLPPSHTEGKQNLDTLGNTFTNLPQPPSGYIKRDQIERDLETELRTKDRHPIVTLTGLGGIGKTTVALEVINRIAKGSSCPYEVILWLSSRDVDLLDTGPKPVTPKVVSKSTISNVVVELLEPSQRSDSEFDPIQFFQKCLTHGSAGCTLVVLDNFETVDDPADIFAWIDTHVRLPNKVLITTRFRDFQGDYPIDVGGMTDSEAFDLIDQEATRLEISNLIPDQYKHELVAESDGHPYVIKVLLGQVANERKAVKPARIVAGADQLLTALFERTYASLSPAAQRVFLLLSSWRSVVPEIAVEAVVLRPDNERFDVQGAIRELRRFSLIEEVPSASENEMFVGVPLAAASFGRKKLKISPLRVAVEADRDVLMEFGAGDKESSRHGVMPRIDILIKSAAREASDDASSIEKMIPILEYLATRVPLANLRIAQLLGEIGGEVGASSRIKTYVNRYLESTDNSERERAWSWLADLCHTMGDLIGEIHALTEIATLSTTTPSLIGVVANKINSRLRELKNRGMGDGSDEVKQLIARTAEQMSGYLENLDATDCSRLAWLYLNIGNENRAFDIARSGNKKDPDNEHCLKILKRLES